MKLVILCIVVTAMEVLPTIATHRNQDPFQVDVMDAEEPLFLTPLLKAGKIEEARSLSEVKLGNLTGKSYSGLLTVNETYGSNLFFWFFPAETGMTDAPLLLWLDAGPGTSSMYSLFNQHGPFSVDVSLNLVPRSHSWTQAFNMLYVDSPVGTGFSFTGAEAGYARDDMAVGHSLHAALTQFFTMFPELKDNHFYATGISHGGKYATALALIIHEENSMTDDKINLKGIAIGNGVHDPARLSDNGEFLYQLGFIDEMGRDYFREQSDLAVSLVQQQKFIKALQVGKDLMGGSHSKSFFTTTGLRNWNNFLEDDKAEALEWWRTFVEQPEVRRALHVGGLCFHDSKQVEQYLEVDMMRNIKPWIEKLLDTGYRVLLYNGQMDIVFPYVATENLVSTLEWTHAGDYYTSPRNVWRVEGEVAGYVKRVAGLVRVLVRNAGHLAARDQPLWVYEMMTRFTGQKSFEDL